MTDYTSILHLPQVGSNQEQKEATINTAIAILEASANDTLVLSLAAGDVTLNTDQFTKYFLHQFTGHTVARQVTIPATPRWFAVENRGTAPIVFKVAGASGLTVELPANRIGLVVADGSNIRFVVPDPISGMGLLRDLSDVDGLPTDGQLLRYDASTAQWKPWTWTAAFTQLSDTPSSLGGSAGKLVAVNAAGNRLEFITSAANINSFVDLDDTPNSYASAANRHVVVNASGTALTFARPYLRENSDFPSSYNTHARKFLRVNAAADAVEFGNPAVADLMDGPGAPTINEALLYVRVNAAGTGWEYVTGTGGPVNFTELHDTPSNFTGHKGKLVRVGQDEDQLIFSELKLTELSDTPNNYTDAAHKILKVNATQSGVVFGTLKVEELSDGPGPMAAAQRGLYVRVNATNTGLEYVKPALSELSGVPSFAGQGGKFVRVNDSETGLDFAINAMDMAFIGLSDTPVNYSGSQNKFVAVNAQGTGLVFVPPPTGGGGGGGPYSLDQITDVDAPDPAAGQVLTFRDGWWRPETPTGGVIGVTALSELTDVNFTIKAPEEGDVLTFESGFWVAKPANATPIPQALDDLTDVDLSEGALTNGEVLTYWDGKWIHAPVQVPSGDGLRFGEHRDWRLFFRTADTPPLEIAEFVLRAGSGLPQLAVGGTPSANADAGVGFESALAFDGDPATFWRSGADGADQTWLRYTFAEPQEVNAVSLTFGAVRQLPITWAMQFSDDGGLTWITAWSETRAFGWNAGETVDTEPARAKLAFAMLSDSPGAMSAHPGKFVRVDEDGVRLEYVELPIPATSLEELTDVQFTAPPEEDQVLTFKDGIWQPKDPATSVIPEMALNDLTDVDTAGQQEGDLLGRRAGRWVSLTSPIDYGRHAYWRVVVDDTAAYPGTTTVVVAEVVMRDVPGGPQRATGGTAIGTGGNINGAFDGTVGDAWTAYLPDAWIGYHFAAPVSLQEVALTASSVAGWAPNYSPEAFRVQYSDDGVAWYTAWSVTGQTAWAASQTRVYTRPGLTTRFLDDVDTPDTYVGQAGKLVHVKTDESGLEFVDKPVVPEDLGDLGDVDVVTTPPGADSVLIYYPQIDLPGVWRPGLLHLDMLSDVHVPYDPVNGQVLTWVDTGVEGSGRWEARTPENGGGPGTEYPISITDDRWIESGEGAPTWPMPSGSLYMRHDPGDLMVSRATPRLAPRVVQEYGRIVENAGAVSWGYAENPIAGNWLILIYASGSNGAVTLAPGWTTVNQGVGADLSVTVAYRKVQAAEDWPLDITTQSGPEDAYAIYEVSGLGENWADFYQAAQAVGSTAGSFAPTPYTTPATTPFTFAVGAMFQLGGAAPVATDGEFFNEPVTDSTGTLSIAAATNYGTEPTQDLTMNGTVAAGSSHWAYGVLYVDAVRSYGDDLEPSWARFLVEGEGGAKSLDELTDVDLTVPPQNGQALVYRDGSWKAEAVEGAGLDPDRQQIALLIVNPGAEDGMTGWTNTAGAFTSETSAGSLGAPFEGTRIFRATQNTSPCEMAQTIAIDAALWDYIDIGRGSVDVAFRYGRVNTDGSTALVTLEALNETGTLITSSASPAYTTTTTWQLGSVHHALPPLTRSVRLVVRSTRTGTMNYGAFDAFSGLIKIASAHPALSDLPDVGPWTTAPVAGQVLTYLGGVWMNETPSAGNLDALTDVTLTTPAAGQILVYRAGQWINESPQGTGVPSNGSHAHWRLLIDQTDGDASQVGIQDIWFRQTKTGPQLATGGTATASSSQSSSQGPEGAFDGVTGGAWFSAAGNPVGQWIAYAFPAPVEVRYLDLKGSQDYPTRSPRAFKVQWSDDGSTWTTAWTVTGQTGWAPNQTRQFHAPMDLFFTDLADAPPSYIGQAGKPVRVKSDESGMEFGHDSLGDLTDVSFPTAPSDGEVLTRVGGQWRSAPPTTGAENTSNWTAPWRGALVERTTDLTSVTFPTTVPWQAETSDTDGFFTTSAPTRLTIPSGITKVRVTAFVAFTSVAGAGSNYADIYRNGVALKVTRTTARNSSLNGYINNEMTVSTPVISVVPGDYFEIRANSNIAGVNSILARSWAELEVIESDYAINPPEALDDLSDVTLGTPVQDYVLTYDNGVWRAKELPASSGGTVYMADIGDVEMPVGGPGENDVLRYQAGKWRPLPAGSADGLFLDNAMIGSGQGGPTTPRPSGSLYIDEVTGQISQSLKDVPTVAPAPTVVQHILSDAYNSATSAQPITATLPAAPTAGNWLVALLCDQTLATAGSGWTLLPGSPVSGSTRVRPSVAYKQAVSAEPAAQTPFVSGGGQIGAGAMVIYEIAGMSTWSESFQGVVWEDDTSYSSAASGMARAPLTARALHDGLGLGLYVTRPNSSTLTPDAPWTTLSSGVAPTGGGNRVYVATSAAAAAGTSIAPKATFTGASEAGYVTILLDNGPATFEEGWRPYTGNIALDDLTDVTSTAPGNGQVLTYRDGAWSPEAAEGEFSGTGEPTATAPLGKVYQQRDSAGNAWVSTLVPAGSTAPTYYTATGTRQSFVVGPQVSSLTFKLWGGGGGTGRYSTGGNPAAGGFTQVTFAVNEGDLIELDVPSGGQGGYRSNYGGAGGWPDGGFGGLGDTAGGGGGGSARVWRNGVLMAVAGGGGGGSGYTATNAGAGGGDTGQSSSTSNGGTGGTQTAGGYDGNDSASAPKRGGYLQGGQGTAAVDRFTSSTDDGGGGGGGYYGGGGGGGDGQPGGGGSGYLNLAAGATGVTEAGDRLVPPHTADEHYQVNVGVGYPTENVTGPAPNGGDGLIVVLAPPYVQGWRRLATSDDVDALALMDLLKVTLQGDGDPDYLLTAQDRRAYRKITSSADKTVTIPPNSDVPFPIGASFSLQRGGIGRVTILAGSGVALEYPDDMQPRLRRQNSVASLVQIATNVWSLFGDLEPV
ncbi:putative tail protein [Brevundimonas phage vB_BpoS-Kikimora]|uniref:receptor protein-tyrosine kinase n=1 Tax=Brevundimonas phage vB_BpoS-Kikimora TaxID=2948601 RepID=A0A9E7MRE5_9CAUD|nr:putative tail protein [Brevundimonas phage vB_BpoS-Kikimora]